MGDRTGPVAAADATGANGSARSQHPPPGDKATRMAPRWMLAARPEHPCDYPQHLKWLVTVLLAAAAFLDPISYTMLYPALPQLPASLGTTQDVANLSSTLSFIGPALAPLYWSVVAERRGRRVVLLSSLAAFVLFSGLSGAATSIAALVAVRVLGSFCSTAGLIAGAAMVADIWPPRTRGFAMSIYYMGPLTGPALGPVLGGALAGAWGWRAVQWFLTAYTGLVLLLVAAFVRETLRPEDRAAVSGGGGALARLRDWAVGPLRAVAFLRFPAVAAVVLVASVCFAAVMMSATTLQEAFHAPPYGFSYLVVGLLYLPMAAGLITGGLLSGKWSDRIMQREARLAARYNRSGLHFYAPESRLKENVWLSISILPGALLMYGWTIQYGLFWVVPMVAWFTIGLSTGLIFSLAATVLTEFMPHKGATLVALNALGRNSFAAVSGSLTQPLATAIGSGWSYTGLAVFSLLNILAMVLFRRYGRQWREAMDEKVGIVRTPEAERQLGSDTEAQDDQRSAPTASDSDEKVAIGPQPV